MHLLLVIIYQAQHRPIERDYKAGRWDIRETVEQREDHRERNMETEKGGYEREQGSTIRFFFWASSSDLYLSCLYFQWSQAQNYDNDDLFILFII